ncbi:EpsG family protein [Photobacterium damselae subsp. damselae]|uniref:EpsG family protein n=1 Tax=Photobacterium damselae subsp. damselae TaxID=85581 RepID=A0A850QW82_PHODD|nr:EpsG family protein [Photobacterium damselae subsp. damselae]
MKYLLVSVVSFIYASILSSIPSVYFRDRVNYYIYAKDFDRISSQYSTFSSKLFNEPIFLYINNFFSFISSDKLILYFVFFIAFTCSFMILNYSRNAMYGLLGLCLLFFIPQTFHLQLVILRQGIATSLLLWFIFFNHNKLDYKLLLFVLLLSFIHTSFFILLGMLLIDKILIDKNIRFFAQLTYGIFIGFSYHLIGIVFSIRQVTESHMESVGSVSGISFIIWSSILYYIYRYYRATNDIIILISIYGLIFYLSNYFISPISGRIFSTFLPFILITLLKNMTKQRVVILIFLLLSNLLIFPTTISNNSLLIKIPSLF